MKINSIQLRLLFFILVFTTVKALGAPLHNFTELSANVIVSEVASIDLLMRDDTEDLQNLISRGGSISLKRGKIYRVSKPIFVKIDNTDINGNDCVIQFSYSQKESDPSFSESLFVVKNRKDISFRNIRLEYRGPLDVGGSYKGMVSGLYVTGTTNFVADNVEAYNFNRAGINIGAGTQDYNIKPIIKNSYLHHNRVAGCLYGNNVDGIVEGNKFFYNGLLGDTGTGYGFTGWSASLPKNTLVKNNSANFNFRKGIDFHSGLNGEILNNICRNNYITGIFVHGVIGDWTISNNEISNMKSSNSTSPSISGIEIGNRDRNRNQDQLINFKIIHNKILSFNSDNGKSAIPILIHIGSIGKGGISIMNNEIICDKTSGFILANTGGIRKNSRFYDIIITGNFFTANETSTIPINLKGEKSRRKVIEGNSITIKSGSKKIAYVIASDKSTVGQDEIISRDNKIIVPNALFNISKLIQQR